MRCKLPGCEPCDAGKDEEERRMVYHVLMHAILTFRVCGACCLRYEMAGVFVYLTLLDKKTSSKSHLRSLQTALACSIVIRS